MPGTRGFFSTEFGKDSYLASIIVEWHHGIHAAPRRGKGLHIHARCRWLHLSDSSPYNKTNACANSHDTAACKKNMCSPRGFRERSCISNQICTIQTASAPQKSKRGVYVSHIRSPHLRIINDRYMLVFACLAR
jgi:hypothetical protein